MSSLEEVARWVLRMGTHATVVEPEKLRERMFGVAEELWQRSGGCFLLHEGGGKAVRKTEDGSR